MENLPADALFNLSREKLDSCLDAIALPLKGQHEESQNMV